MKEFLLDIKQGGHPIFRVLTGKACEATLVDPPSFFFSTPPEALMQIKPPYKDVPFIQEKLKTTKKLINIDRDTIATWEASEPNYPLMCRVKEQLGRNEKLLKEITGAQPCQ